MDFETLVTLAVGSFVVTRLIDLIVKPLWVRFNLDVFYLGYVSLGIGATLSWFTELNAFPIFTVSVIGRVLTCLAGGLGPAAIYDLLIDKPKPPIDGG